MADIIKINPYLHFLARFGESAPLFDSLVSLKQKVKESTTDRLVVNYVINSQIN